MSDHLKTINWTEFIDQKVLEKSEFLSRELLQQSIVTVTSASENDNHPQLIVAAAVITVIVLISIIACSIYCCCIHCEYLKLWRSSTLSLNHIGDTSELFRTTETDPCNSLPDVTIGHALFRTDLTGIGHVQSKSTCVNFDLDICDEQDAYQVRLYNDHYLLNNYERTININQVQDHQAVEESQDATPVSSSSSSSSSPSVSRSSSSVNDEGRGVSKSTGAPLPDVSVKEFCKHMENSEIRTVEGKRVVFIARTVDESGDKLVLNLMGISLTVPPGAIEKGHQETIFLILSWDFSDYPDLQDDQCLVSAVIHCGPHGLKFQKQCTLAFQHCAADTTQVNIWASETDYMLTKQWRPYWKEGKENKDENDGVQILPKECQISITHFTLFTSLLTTLQTQTVPKRWLQVAPFARPLERGKFYEIRIYLLINTPCALQFAKVAEKDFGAELLTQPITFLLHGDHKDMCLELDRVSEGWENQDKDLEVVSFQTIWQTLCVHNQFVFKPQNTAISQINMTFNAYQNGRRSEAVSVKIVATSQAGGNNQEFNSSCPVQPVCNEALPTMTDTTTTDAEIQQKQSGIPSSTEDRRNDAKNELSMIDVRQVCSYHIPQKLRIKLQARLDGRCPLSNNWKAFAQALGLEEFINCIDRRDSPTNVLLNEYEKMGKTLLQLAELMADIGRHDVHRVIMDYITEQDQKKSVSIIPVESVTVVQETVPHCPINQNSHFKPSQESVCSKPLNSQLAVLEHLPANLALIPVTKL
ncbi:UNC5C-like protein [Glandiceps talaboti]